MWVYSAVLISRLVLTPKKIRTPKNLEILGKVRTPRTVLQDRALF